MAKAIREATGKDILVKYLRTLVAENGVDKKLLFPVKTATVTPNINYAELAKDNPWLETEVGNSMQLFVAAISWSVNHS